jgi:hypothetical protein
VIELAYFEGLSSAQIAERLGIPTGTVKSRMARALTTLRATLARAPDSPPDLLPESPPDPRADPPRDPSRSPRGEP